MLKDMPVAYNLNLIVLDREGRCAWWKPWTGVWQ